MTKSKCDKHPKRESIVKMFSAYGKVENMCKQCYDKYNLQDDFEDSLLHDQDPRERI